MDTIHDGGRRSEVPDRLLGSAAAHVLSGSGWPTLIAVGAQVTGCSCAGELPADASPVAVVANSRPQEGLSECAHDGGPRNAGIHLRLHDPHRGLSAGNGSSANPRGRRAEPAAYRHDLLGQEQRGRAVPHEGLRRGPDGADHQPRYEERGRTAVHTSLLAALMSLLVVTPLRADLFHPEAVPIAVVLHISDVPAIAGNGAEPGLAALGNPGDVPREVLGTAALFRDIHPSPSTIAKRALTPNPARPVALKTRR